MGLIAAKRIEEFGRWLERRGRAPGTVDLYLSNLTRCAEGESLVDRLLDKGLAPKTRRTNKAALAAWAKFDKDAELKEELDEIRLPPATRLTPKVPLEIEDWRTFVKHVEAHEKIPDHIRATILIMARRGLRIGDVLRIERKESTSALKTGRFSYVGKGDKRIEISAIPIRQPLEMLVGLGSWDVVHDLYGGLNEKMAKQKVRRRIKIIGNELSMPGVHPHRLRRSYATMFLERHKGDPRALMKLVEHMSWSGIAVASGYVDSVNKDELDQIGADMIEDLLK